MSLGYLKYGAGEDNDDDVRLRSSVYPAVIWVRAMALSNGVTGISPQSRILAQEVYGLNPARVLNPRKEVWRPEAARMARGPKRAP